MHILMKSPETPSIFKELKWGDQAYSREINGTIKPHRIFNLDEGGYSSDDKGGYILTQKRVKKARSELGKVKVDMYPL